MGGFHPPSHLPANRYCLQLGGSGGASPEEVQVKLGKILQGADPKRSEAAVQKRLHDAGFGGTIHYQQPVLECLVDEENGLNIDVRGCCWPLSAGHDSRESADSVEKVGPSKLPAY